MFFIETSEVVEVIAGRTLCSLESAARANPDRQIILIMSSKAKIQTVPDYMKVFANVKFRTVDIDAFTKGNESKKKR